MKDIKDYLHLYLGCECSTKYVDWDHWNHPIRLTSQTLQRLEDDLSFQVKPILRPLFSLTNQERAERGRAITNSGNIEAEYHRWMLSKGFDLFNLIEEGLAIDATKN